MIYNPLTAQKQSDDLPDTDVLPFTVPVKLAMDRTFIPTINRIQAKQLAICYPDNFYLHFTKNVLRMKRPIRKPEIITLPQIARLLARDNTKLIAWCWYSAVHWTFLTDTMFAYCSTAFSESDGLVIKDPSNDIVSVSVGITFDETVEALFLLEDSAIQILFNPLHIEKKWLLADVIDLAIHECTHWIVRAHDERFIQLESRLRKEFRRIVDEQSLLDEARDMVSIFE